MVGRCRSVVDRLSIGSSNVVEDLFLILATCMGVEDTVPVDDAYRTVLILVIVLSACDVTVALGS